MVKKISFSFLVFFSLLSLLLYCNGVRSIMDSDFLLNEFIEFTNIFKSVDFNIPNIPIVSAPGDSVLVLDLLFNILNAIFPLINFVINIINIVFSIISYVISILIWIFSFISRAGTISDISLLIA